MTRAYVLALACIALSGAAIGGCRARSADTPEAAPTLRPFAELPLVVPLPPAWSIHADAGTPGLDVRRRGDPQRPFLVSPRLALQLVPPLVRDDATRETAAERADAELRGLRALETDGAIRIDKASRGQGPLGGRVAELLVVAYEVPTPERGPVPMVQEVRVLETTTSSGSPALLTLTIDYVARDAEVIASEVDAVLKTMHFAP